MKKQKLLLFPVLLASLALGSCSLQGNHHEVIDYMSELAYHDGFRIVQFSDLHLSSQRNLEEDYAFLTKLVKDAKEAKPIDLIVFTGDLFTFASKLTIEHTFEVFDSWEVPWTLTFGNHDEQLFGDFTFTAEAASKAKNCVFKYIHDDMTGLTNSVVNLTKDNHIKFQIFAIDSNTYSYQNGIGYDYIHEDQIQWYKNCIEYANKKEDSSWTVGKNTTIPSLVFQHIPLPEIKQAIKDYQDGTLPGEGDNRESGSPSKTNSGFYQVIKDYKSTKAIIVGHDHVNDSNITVDTSENIHFVYGVKSTNNIYHDNDMLGYRLIEVDSDGNFDTEAKTGFSY